MSDVLTLPKRAARTQLPRKTFYVTDGTVNRVPIMLDGKQVESYFKCDAARLTGMAIRKQSTKSGASFIVDQSIVVDGVDVGLIDEDGNTVPHPLLSESRYASWDTATDEAGNPIPKRIKAQQWVQVDNVEMLHQAVAFLQANGFTLVRNPRPPRNSQRRTRDDYLLRPTQRYDRNNPTSFGVRLDGFEVNINEDYIKKGPGFSSFYQGLTEQVERWESASAETNEDVRAERMEELARTLHFIGGVHENEAGDYWPRPVDVGLTVIDGAQLALYRVGGAPLDASELFSLLEGDNGKRTREATSGIPMLDQGALY